MAESKKLCRSENGKILGGVCAGIAKYYNTDPTMVRIVTLVVGLITGVIPLLVVYVIAYFMMKPDS